MTILNYYFAIASGGRRGIGKKLTFRINYNNYDVGLEKIITGAFSEGVGKEADFKRRIMYTAPPFTVFLFF